MGRENKNVPFERVLDEVERKYHNFDGQGHEEEYEDEYEQDYELEYDMMEGDDYELEYDYAEGSARAMAKPQKLFQADPYQVVIENTTDRPLIAVLFGNDKYLLQTRFGNPAGITISVGQPGVEYVELLQESSTKPFSTQFMRIESDNDLQISKFLTINKKGANGIWLRRNVNLQQFKSAYQQDKRMLDVPIEEEVNGSTYWEMEMEPKSRTFITIFPLYKVDTSGALGGDQPIKTFAPAQVNTHGMAIPRSVRPSVRPVVRPAKRPTSRPSLRPKVRPRLSGRR
jgi:hypothetical protein